MEPTSHQDESCRGRTPAAGPSDEALLSEIRRDVGGPRGRQVASTLLARYQDRVYAWCFRYVRERELALDLAQEALLSAYRHLGDFGERSRFSSWLFAIARNRCLSELRKMRLEQEDAELLELVGDWRPAPDRALQEKTDEAALLDTIRTCLEPAEQEAIWLRCIERLPVDEITRLLEVREASGARALLQRARRRLRAALGERRKGEVPP